MSQPTWVKGISDAERYILDRWEWFVVRQRIDGSWQWFGSLTWQRDPELADSREAAINSAFAYTKLHEQRMAAIQAEIFWLKSMIECYPPCKDELPLAEGILRREAASLAEMLKGYNAAR